MVNVLNAEMKIYTNGDEIGHAYHCHKCDHIGKEWYTLTYLETR